MKRFAALILTGILLLTFAGCGNSGNAPSGSTEESKTSGIADNNTSASTASGGNNSTENTEGGSKMLVAYFSLAGEQYGVGVIEEGNTSIIAHMIAEQTGADLFEIKAVKPYPTSHSELLDVSRKEMSDKARPEIADTVDNMDDYDTVFIGYPNWWGDMPMIVYNFLESYDLSGKTIVPFCTHGGSGLSGTERTIRNITGGTMADGFAIAGTTAQNDRDTAKSKVTEWLREGGFVE